MWNKNIQFFCNYFTIIFLTHATVSHDIVIYSIFLLSDLGDCSPAARKAIRRAAARRQSNTVENKDGEAKADIKILKVESGAGESGKDTASSHGSVPTRDKTASKDMDCAKEMAAGESCDNSIGVLPVRPFSGLQTTDSEAGNSCSNNNAKLPEKLLASVSSPVVNAHDSSHGESVVSGIKSDLSSSPDVKENFKKEVCSEPANVRLETVGEVETDSVKKHPLVSNKIQEKLELLREGVTAETAHMISVADLYLMMGNPEKIILEYEWVDLKPVQDILDLGHLTNMLRRLIHLASTEFTDFSKPLRPPASHSLVKEEQEEASGSSSVNTPPSTKGSRGSKVMYCTLHTFSFLFLKRISFPKNIY